MRLLHLIQYDKVLPLLPRKVDKLNMNSNASAFIAVNIFVLVENSMLSVAAKTEVTAKVHSHIKFHEEY